MPCYHPLNGWRSRLPNENGRKPVVVLPKGKKPDKLEFFDPMQLPCGNCWGCRLERSRQWALRCLHESTLHEFNCFITLTYNDEHIPLIGDKERVWSTLRMRDFQLFMKRLRKNVGQCRFFHCGEYGSKNGRPHYHAIIFGLDFRQHGRVTLLRRKSDFKEPLWRSSVLDGLWSDPDSGEPLGHASVGSCTFKSAAYCARYIMEKANGELADERYDRICSSTGEVFRLQPEYTTMSRRPGIGQGWFKRYWQDAYPSDCINVDGQRMRPPKYYDQLFEDLKPLDLVDVKKKRLAKLMENAEDNTPERLAVREEVAKARTRNLRRDL